MPPLKFEIEKKRTSQEPALILKVVCILYVHMHTLVGNTVIEYEY